MEESANPEEPRGEDEQEAEYVAEQETTSTSTTRKKRKSVHRGDCFCDIDLSKFVKGKVPIYVCMTHGDDEMSGYDRVLPLKTLDKAREILSGLSTCPGVILQNKAVSDSVKVFLCQLDLLFVLE